MDFFLQGVMSSVFIPPISHWLYREGHPAHLCKYKVVIGHGSIKGFFHTNSYCVVFGGCEECGLSGLVIVRIINMAWNVLPLSYY